MENRVIDQWLHSALTVRRKRTEPEFFLALGCYHFNENMRIASKKKRVVLRSGQGQNVCGT